MKSRSPSPTPSAGSGTTSIIFQSLRVSSGGTDSYFSDYESRQFSDLELSPISRQVSQASQNDQGLAISLPLPQGGLVRQLSYLLILLQQLNSPSNAMRTPSFPQSVEEEKEAEVPLFQWGAPILPSPPAFSRVRSISSNPPARIIAHQAPSRSP